jgi:hypothetical protein
MMPRTQRLALLTGGGVSPRRLYMGAFIDAPPHAARPRGDAFIRAAAIFWFAASFVGLLLFGIYIFGFYGPTLVNGQYEAWSANKNLIDGYVADDGPGNLQFAAHVALAGVLTLGGLVQVVPALRKRSRTLHRWNGRVFIAAAFAAAIGGLWLVWVRGTQSGLGPAIGISLNAVLIMLFASLAWRAAMQKRFQAHEAWAFRAFLVVNGVWFLRVGMAVYGAVAMGVLGLEDLHMEVVFPLWSFGSFLLPLAVYEAYRAARRSERALAKGAMGAVLIALGLATLVGSGGMFAMQWMPLLLNSAGA